MMQGMQGMDGVMEGMLWAGLFMVAVPLLIGIGVAILLLRRRGHSAERSGSATRAG